MNRSSLFNPPVQGSVPATPETHHDPKGVSAPSEPQTNPARFGCPAKGFSTLGNRRFPRAACVVFG